MSPHLTNVHGLIDDPSKCEKKTPLKEKPAAPARFEPLEPLLWGCDDCEYMEPLGTCIGCQKPAAPDSLRVDWDMIEPLIHDDADLATVQAIDRLRAHFGHKKPSAKPAAPTPRTYISKDTYLIEEALEKVLAFSPNPGNQPLQGIIDGLREFLKMNVVKDEPAPAALPLSDGEVNELHSRYHTAAPNAPNARRQTLNPVACAPTLHSQEPIAGSPDSQDRDGDGKAAAADLSFAPCANCGVPCPKDKIACERLAEYVVEYNTFKAKKGEVCECGHTRLFFFETRNMYKCLDCGAESPTMKFKETR